MRKETRCPQIFTLETQRFSPGCKSDRLDSETVFL
ncbi:hypothetical protein SPLC1_S202210 [Arthrospira platensis C1]|nr:hypothetical protein SPLC1_S202210 [Arthrospira platensis C1]